jgi:hypothetical protein
MKDKMKEIIEIGSELTLLMLGNYYVPDTNAEKKEGNDPFPSFEI